jgi:hypothetical protein
MKTTGSSAGLGVNRRTSRANAMEETELYRLRLFFDRERPGRRFLRRDREETLKARYL